MLDASDIAALEAQAWNDGIKILAVGAAIRWEDSLLIVTRSPEEEVFPNNAEIPGGGVEKGEGILEGLAREMHEETGLQIASITAYLGHMDFIGFSGDPIRQFNFLVEPTHNEVRLNPLEHSTHEWLPVDGVTRLHELEMTDLMRSTIMDILRQM